MNLFVVILFIIEFLSIFSWTVWVVVPLQPTVLAGCLVLERLAGGPVLLVKRLPAVDAASAPLVIPLVPDELVVRE
jgi:hypothetical protein